MRNRAHEVHLRLDDKEYNALMKNAAKCNMPLQTYLRHMCMATEPREAPSADFGEYIKELRKIGNDLNQIAMLAHRTGSVDRAEYSANYMRLMGEINKLHEALYFPEWVIEEYLKEKSKKLFKEELNETTAEN